jgi:hypothetical protein
MRRHRIRSLLRLRKKAGVVVLPVRKHLSCDESTIKVIGWTSLAVGVAALGVYLGRELRLRYKFNHRTPYDYYSHAGDESTAAEYGMGI